MTGPISIGGSRVHITRVDPDGHPALARVFVGTVYAVCVLGMIAAFVAVIVFTDNDP